MSEQIPINTEVMVDLDEVARVVKSEAFARFLLDQTCDFTAAAYILQALLDRLAADGQQVDFD
jgi:hypothetical protein